MSETDRSTFKGSPFPGQSTTAAPFDATVPVAASPALSGISTPERCVECGATDTLLERGPDGQMRCLRRSGRRPSGAGTPSSETPALDLVAMESRAHAATDGPWRVYERPAKPSEAGRREFPEVSPRPELCIGTARDHPQLKAPDFIVTTTNSPYIEPTTRLLIRREDADFIAQARDDVPALIAEVRRLRWALDQYEMLRQAVNESTHECGPSCSKYGHDENCPACDPANWLADQQREIARLRTALAASREDREKDAENAKRLASAIDEALTLLATDEIEIHEQPQDLLVEACYRVRDVLSAARGIEV